MELKKYKLGEIATVEISGVDKKMTDGEKEIRLCNFVDVYYNWAITIAQHDSFMLATARPNEISKFQLKKGQVALTKDSETRNDIGISTYIADDFEDVILGYHCALISPNKDILDGRYLNALLHTDYAKKYFACNASGSGQRYALSVETLNSFPVPIIPLHEQKQIGEIFSALDKKIELNRAINQNLEAMAKQLYDYWFVQFDFPNEEGEPYKLSGGKMVWNEKLKREIPEGWNVMSINEICTSCRGVSYGKDDLLSNGSGVLVLRGNNIDNNHIVYDSNVAFVPYNFVSKEQHIKAGDIIMTMSSGSKAHVGKCAMFHKDSEHTFGAFLSKFTPKKELRYMTFLFLTSGYFKSLITAFCNGTGINNLTNQIFDDVLLVLPDEKKTRLFESKVSGLFAMIGNNEENMRILTKQRDELLPLLMNGQVSVNSDLSASGEKERKNLLLNQKHFLHI